MFGRHHASLEVSGVGMQVLILAQMSFLTCQFCCPGYTRRALLKAVKGQDPKPLSLFALYAVSPLQQGSRSLLRAPILFHLMDTKAAQVSLRCPLPTSRPPTHILTFVIFVTCLLCVSHSVVSNSLRPHGL